MKVFYQHIGETLWDRDSPRSIGTPPQNLRKFSFDEIVPFLDSTTPMEIDVARRAIDSMAPKGFQIWGLPGPADRVIHKMAASDQLLLLESFFFRYIGRIIHKFSNHCWGLSEYIWKENRFPLIVLIDGSMIKYDWDSFKADFDYGPNYDWKKLRGRTNPISDEKMRTSKFGDSDTFARSVISRFAE